MIGNTAAIVQHIHKIGCCENADVKIDARL